jgi:hypothetical protein
MSETRRPPGVTGVPGPEPADLADDNAGGPQAQGPYVDPRSAPSLDAGTPIGLWTMPQRYDISEDREGWTVFDVFTGEPVVISDVPQTGLDIQDADELAELLDHKTFANDRTLRQ